MTERWVKATDAGNGLEIWLNMAQAVSILPFGEGSAITFLSNESPDQGGFSTKEPPEHFLFFNDAMAAEARGFLNRVRNLPIEAADGPGIVREANRAHEHMMAIADAWRP
jgi:hypothetical protein